MVDPLGDALQDRGVAVEVWDSVATEPTVGMFEEVRKACRETRPDLVVGIGGGSVLDTAKLVAALNDSNEQIHDLFGIGKLRGRRTKLACLPTTSGTGSEVSPNAILLDEDGQLKRAVVSSHLVADSAYVDPELTTTVPSDVTAYTGMDALTHCIEAYANRFSHPMVDLFALKGIQMISGNLVVACKEGGNLVAREGMAMGSLCGGLCLGPVNTGAVHALAYPLGGEFHVPHGISNSLLLPYVLEFNIPSMPERYADIARALGVEDGGTHLEMARQIPERILGLMGECGLPLTLSEIGIPSEAIPAMAESAITVTRLLKNNPRKMAIQDIRGIYERAH
jgi:alcohol dehydrogenase class IV